MNFLAFIPILNTIIAKLFPDQAQQDAAKAQLLTIMAQADNAEMKAKGEIIVAEASGQSKWQQNWRPHLMYLFMTVIGMNYILLPMLATLGVHIQPLPIPENMWTLLEISVGGYVVGRSGEKIASQFAKSGK